MSLVAKPVHALTLAVIAIIAAGCGNSVVQTATPPTLRIEPPAHAVDARYLGHDVHVTYTPTTARPTRGWLVVERFPDDGHLSVVPAYPYSSYANYHGIVNTVYSDQFRGRTLVSAMDVPREVPEKESLQLQH